MPLVVIVTNASATLEAKQQLVKAVSALVATTTRSSTDHVQIHIQDQQFLSFGGDITTPAAYVTFKVATGLLAAPARFAIVQELVSLLGLTYPGILPPRIHSIFQEVPVENLGVGASIANFQPPTRTASFK